MIYKVTMRELFINVNSFETRIAYREEGVLTEYYIDQHDEKRIVGSVYRAKVIKVLPGMQSCFVDIGLDRSAFLYSGDIKAEEEAVEEDDLTSSLHQQDEIHGALPSRVFKISELVKEGDELLVQIAKEPIGTKGARVTTFINLPGHYVVLMPNIEHIGISRHVEKEEDKERLRSLMEKYKPDGMGLIARTSALDVSEDKIITDIKLLIQTWEKVKQRSQNLPTPSLVHEDFDFVFRIVRDLATRGLSHIFIDNKRYFENLKSFLEERKDSVPCQLEYITGRIFENYGIQEEIDKALDPKVWLKSGGYLIIQQTEALTAIDINTGRFVGNQDLEDTVLKTNKEAVEEIVHQLRLRNLGGIIVIDFIDMQDILHREELYNLLIRELKKDRARSTVLNFSEFGLIQMTRKRTEQSIVQKLTASCTHCLGKGFIKNLHTICHEILRDLESRIQQKISFDFIVRAHGDVINLLLKDDKTFLEEITRSRKVFVSLETLRQSHLEYYEINTVVS